MDDTIAAIITPIGAASVGIIRISGPQADAAADRIFRSSRGLTIKESATHKVIYGRIIDQEGRTIDEALALKMKAPHSFTGEDVVELQCHGGIIVLRKVLDLVLQAGARLAEPGEFSKRAFLNGRLDISQAEAIMDIINAKTETAVRAAANNLEGSIAREVRQLRSSLLEIIAYLEADIDFPEEDITRLNQEEIHGRISAVEKALTEILLTYRSGRIIREGLKTALIGKPNVGKSSLLNALLKEKRAIVTDVPGTTRDIIQEYYNLGGIPLILIDTAGLRPTEDLVERLGVEKTRETIAEADLILYVLDVTEGVTAEDLNTLKSLPRGKVLLLVNKIDLLEGEVEEDRIRKILEGYQVLYISAKENMGLKELEEGIARMFLEEGLEITTRPFLTNTRQKHALEKACSAVKNAWEAFNNQMPSDFISIDLRQAWFLMGEVTGETLGEDIIDQIFSRFCLGK